MAFFAGRPGTYTPESSLGEPCETEKGDLQAELAASAVVVDAEYTTPEEHHSAMEPHAATARWDGGRLEVVDSNQGSMWVAEELAKLFSLDPASVRVRSEHVGGAFGAKGVRPHQVCAVMAATVLHRPVRVVLTRRQTFSLVGYRSPTAQRVRLGADADGRLRAFDHQAQSLTSTVHEFVERSADPGRVMYAADAHHTVNRLVTARRADPDLHACAGRGARLVRAGVRARRARREVRHGPDRAARPQRTGRGAGLRSAVQQPQSARLFPGGRPQVRLGGPGPAPRHTPRGALAARDRDGRRLVPCPGRFRPRLP